MAEERGGGALGALVAPMVAKFVLLAKAAYAIWRISTIVARVARTANAVRRTVRMAKTISSIKKAAKTVEAVGRTRTISATKGKMDKIQAAMDVSDRALNYCEKALRESTDDANKNLEQNGQQKVSAAKVVSKFIDPVKKFKVIVPSFKLLWRAYKGLEAKKEVSKTVAAKKKRSALKKLQAHLPHRGVHNEKVTWYDNTKKKPNRFISSSRGSMSSAPVFNSKMGQTAAVTTAPVTNNITSF